MKRIGEGEFAAVLCVRCHEGETTTWVAICDECLTPEEEIHGK